MIDKRQRSSLLASTGFCLILGLVFTVEVHTQAPAAGAHNAADPVPAFMISDLHFDPFADPAKVKQLNAAAVSDWKSILSSAPSSDQQEAFASLQKTCRARGVDTPYPLLHSALLAMHERQSGARFITVSGDLIAHGFTCRYSTLFPQSTAADYEGFVLKTLAFVTTDLRATFPQVPVYIALGNNDSGCGDYKLDAHGSFLAHAGPLLAADLPEPQRQEMEKVFPAGGYYSVNMAAPMQNTRLVVVNDLFLSDKYKGCSGDGDTAATAAQLTWLQQQLADAQRLHQRVWLMGHIPPGVNSFSTALKGKNICSGAAPVLFLGNDKMTDLMVQYAPVIRLAIFAHTHMDELRLLQSEGDTHTSVENKVAVKIVSSISPVDGNNPSFTLAQVDPSSAILQDYEVDAASNKTGVGTAWNKEYSYSQAYRQPDFSPGSLAKTINAFASDRDAKNAASQSYIRNYYVGDRSPELKPFWPEYVCALANSSAKSFTSCACAAAK